MKSLPTLRRKILQSFLLVIFLYGILGSLLVSSVFLASNTTPRLIHVNYDSISAVIQMRQAWNALGSPQKYSAGQSEQELLQHRSIFENKFEDALKFEEGNTTEPGEKDTAASIRRQWDQDRKDIAHLSVQRFLSMDGLLGKVIALNENGMFGIAASNQILNRQVLVGSILYFVITFIVVILFSQQFALRLAKPLKDIAEILHSRPSVSGRLKLPEPTTLELLILTTEMKRLWERLSASEKVNVADLLNEKTKLEVVLESVEDALLFTDSRGVVSHCNETLARWVGLPREQVEDHHWRDLASMNENYLKLRSVLNEDISDGQEIELKTENGKTQYAARFKRIGAGKSGQTAGTLFLLHDITEKRQRDKFRSEFVDLLSHELKTPLQSLGTASELLAGHRESFSGDLQMIVDTIGEDVERIRAVAQEFVQVTQSHSKIMKLKMERVALNASLPEWIKPFTILAKDRKVKLELIQEGSDSIWANLDRVKFPWVISNLLSNAIRYSPAETTVSVYLTDRNGAVEISVKDQGAGIAEGDRNRIFDAFFQGSSSASARGLFGVGLTIAKEVVEAHEGRIEYFSRSPQGSEFRITLPFPSDFYGET